jgi:hypothetical protein
MVKIFTNIKGRTSNKKAAGQKIIRPRVVTAVTTRSIRVFIGHRGTDKLSRHVVPAGVSINGTISIVLQTTDN